MHTLAYLEHDKEFLACVQVASDALDKPIKFAGGAKPPAGAIVNVLQQLVFENVSPPFFATVTQPGQSDCLIAVYDEADGMLGIFLTTPLEMHSHLGGKVPMDGQRKV